MKVELHVGKNTEIVIRPETPSEQCLLEIFNDYDLCVISNNRKYAMMGFPAHERRIERISLELKKNPDVPQDDQLKSEIERMNV